MVATPFFGPFDVTRSTNLADNQLINLRPEVAQSKQGKAIGAFMGTAGLVLLSTAGAGPINGAHVLGAMLYVVSGRDVYTVDANWTATLIDTVSGSGNRVSMIDNGTQLAIFTDTNGYVGPAGYPLTDGTIGGNGGINFEVGDTVVLSALNGTQSAAAILEVTSIKAGGAITGFKINQAGAFPARPSAFEQLSTTGSGSDFTLTGTVFGSAAKLAIVTLPFATGFSDAQAIASTFQDGFALITEPGTNQMWQSTVDDISVYPALNNAFATGAADNMQALLSLHRLIFVIKQQTTEVWNDAGTSGFSFQPITSVLIQHGTPAWATVQRTGETLCMLSQSPEGQGIVREIVGFIPKRISTHAVETAIQAAATLKDAYALSYQQEGHQFYVLTIPGIDRTFVYDKTESELLGEPIWHQWLSFSNGNFARHWGGVFVLFNETPVLGDHRNGNLYRIDLAALTDNGSPRKWLRSWRALAKPVMQPMRFSSLQIDMQTGIGVAAGENPQIMLEWSDDGGHNFSVQHVIAAGQPGETAKRVRFNRLGSTKRSAGLDRIFQLSSTDAFPVALIGAELDV